MFSKSSKSVKRIKTNALKGWFHTFEVESLRCAFCQAHSHQLTLTTEKDNMAMANNVAASLIAKNVSPDLKSLLTLPLQSS
jgi:hypothetical protein